MSTGLKRTNEELVALYKSERNEDYLQELITQNVGLLNILAGSYVSSIPNSELEDLISESYIPLLRAVDDYDPEQGVLFSSFLKVYVRQHLNRLYTNETRKKRYTGSTPVSYEGLTEINRDGSVEMDRSFTVDCTDFSSIEFSNLLESLELNEKEQVVVNVLMAGGTKGEVAKELKITPASTTYYIRRLREKFITAGYSYAI